MFKKNKWLLLYLILALLLLFTIFAVPKIAAGAMGQTKGNIMTTPSTTPNYH